MTRLPRARSALPIENSTALPSPPPASATASPPSGISVGVPVGPITMTGSSFSRPAHRRELPPISSTISDSRPFALSTHAPVSARPSIIRRLPFAVRDSASKFCRRKNCPGSKCRAAAGARTTTSTIVGVSRSTHATVGRHSSSSLPVNARQAASRASCPSGSSPAMSRANSASTCGAPSFADAIARTTEPA